MSSHTYCLLTTKNRGVFTSEKRDALSIRAVFLFLEVKPGTGQSRLRDLHPLGCGQPNASVIADGELVNVETPTILSLLGAHRHSRCGAPNHILTSPDPIPL